MAFVGHYDKQRLPLVEDWIIRPSFYFDVSFDRLQGSKGRAATKVSLRARDVEKAPSLDFEGRILQYIDDRDGSSWSSAGRSA